MNHVDKEIDDINIDISESIDNKKLEVDVKKQEDTSPVPPSPNDLDALKKEYD